jgi:hypothetical protein
MSQVCQPPGQFARLRYANAAQGPAVSYDSRGRRASSRSVLEVRLGARLRGHLCPGLQIPKRQAGESQVLA